MTSSSPLDQVLGCGPVAEPSQRSVTVLIPPTVLRCLWRSQAKIFSLVCPNASRLLRAVPIPPTLTDMERIECYIRGTSITPQGQVYVPRCSEILPGRLWISDSFSASDLSNINCLGITHVLHLEHHNPPRPGPRVPDVVYARMETPRDTYEVPMVGIIDDAVTFIDTNLRASLYHRILIHCTMGVDWSPSIATACLMNETGCSFLDAQELVRFKREAFRPDPLIDEAIQQWWTLEKLRPEFPIGRGYRKFRWAIEESPSDDT